MWKLLAITLALALGCGAPEKGSSDGIGSQEQGFTVADVESYGTGFGLQIYASPVSGVRSCDWSSSAAVCYFPNDKILKLNDTYWTALAAEYYYWFEQYGVTNVNIAGAFTSAISTYESLTGWDVQSGTEIRHEVTNGTGWFSDTTISLAWSIDDFEYFLRPACLSSGVYTEATPYAAQLRQCNSWRMNIDVDGHSEWVIATTAPLSYSVEQTERYKHVRRMLVLSLMLASGIGANGADPKTDYMSAWFPAGMTTYTLGGNNKINKNDRCQLDNYVVYGSPNPIGGGDFCDNPWPPEY